MGCGNYFRVRRALRQLAMVAIVITVSMLIACGGAQVPASSDPAQDSPAPVGHVDWNASLGGGTLVDGQFPAKYNDNPGVSETCTDWVVYGANVAGGSHQANLVAYANLYPGTCSTTGTIPTLKFAYYVPGPITTSPVISADGTKIAFVEGANNGANAIFHVVSTSGAGTLSKPIVATSYASINLGSSDTLSSPYVDYTNDIAYVGTDDGNLHKITGVFKGTPTAAGSPWPVQLSANLSANYGAYVYLTSPVLYNPSGSGLGVVLVAGNYLQSANPLAGWATLFSVNANNAATSMAIEVGGFSVSDAPLVDVANNRAYLFSGNSNSTWGDSGPPVIEQAALSYSGSTFSFGAITAATMGGVVAANPSGQLGPSVHSGAFDNGWYTTGTGYIVACGTAKTTAAPTLYSFRVTGGTLTTTPVASAVVSTSTSDLCSPVTEAYDGTTDRFFVGTQFNGNTSVCASTGCVQDFTLTSGSPVVSHEQTENGGTSAIVVDAGTGASTYIYFTTLSSSGNGGNNNPAIQLSQQKLQ